MIVHRFITFVTVNAIVLMSLNMPPTSLSSSPPPPPPIPCSSNHLLEANDDLNLSLDESLLVSAISYNSKQSVGCGGTDSSNHTSSNDIEVENIRERRSIDQDCSTGMCCLKSFYFDFHEHGMINVVSPSGFNMNYCDGECNETFEISNRHLILMQDKINHPESPLATRLSCCAPVKWSSVEIVENRNGAEYNRTLKDVKVIECGCEI